MPVDNKATGKLRREYGSISAAVQPLHESGKVRRQVEVASRTDLPAQNFIRRVVGIATGILRSGGFSAIGPAVFIGRVQDVSLGIR